MFIHRKSGSIWIVREPQFDLPTTEPLLTLLSTSKEALLSIGLSEEEVRMTPKLEVVELLYRFTALVYARAIIGQVASWDTARRCEMLNANINPKPYSWRWVAWLEPGDDDELWSYGQNVCFTGFCDQEGLAELAERFGKSDKTFLAFPIFDRATHQHSPQLIVSEWDDELEETLALF